MISAPDVPALMDTRERSSLLEQNISWGRQLAESKWGAECQGLQGFDAACCAILLENMEKYFHSLTETTKAISIGDFEKFAFPIVRAVFPNLIANEIVSVQPMSGPISLVFYLDFTYGNSKGSINKGDLAFSSLTGPASNASYTSETIDVEAVATTDGVNTHFETNLAWLPIRAGTVVMTDGTLTLTDNGAGVLVSSPAGASGTVDYNSGRVTIDYVALPAAGLPITVTYEFDMEANQNLPQIDLRLTSTPVTARPRKLRARWSLEASQNLQALHGLDAEAELVAVIAEEIKREIDRTILNDLFNGAIGGSGAFDRKVPDGISFTEHKLSFIDTIVEMSNEIFRVTQRAHANWLVTGMQGASIIETLPTFKAEPVPAGVTGPVRIGVLNGRWAVYKDPQMAVERFLVGYKGGTFLDAGYVYAPFIPLYATPTVLLDDFLGRKGLATRFGKKFINGRYYSKGTIITSA